MSQTLVIHDNQSFASILALNLPTYVGTDVVLKKSFSDAQTLFEHHPGIDLIISVDAVEKETTAELIHKMNQNFRKDADLIVLGTKCTLSESPKVTILPANASLKAIIQASAKLLGITPKSMVELIVPDYFPIKIDFCTGLRNAPCDVYFMTPEKTYEKKFREGDAINPSIFPKMLEAGVTKIFVDAPNRLKFVNFISQDLLARLSNSSATEEDKIAAVDDAIHIVQEQAGSLESPVSKVTEELTMSAIKSCIELAKINPSVAELLKKLISSKASFLYRHTQLIIFISEYVISKIEWGSVEQKEKLAFVAFFHDLFITDDRMASFRDEATVASDRKMSPMQKESLFMHARLAAEMVQKFPAAPIGADVIILQHHGMLSGQGYAKTFTNSLSPLAIVFIVAEELAHLILENESADNLVSKKDEMLNNISRKYPRSNYLRVVETLRDIKF